MSDNFVVNVEGAIYKGDEWLMIMRSEKEDHAGGTLSMVGGTIEHTDSYENILEEALRREIKEEVDIQVGPHMEYVESKQFVTNIGKHVIDIVLLCEYQSGEPKAVCADEVASVGWMTLKAIENNEKTPPWILQSMRIAERMRLSRAV